MVKLLLYPTIKKDTGNDLIRVLRCRRTTFDSQCSMGSDKAYIMLLNKRHDGSIVWISSAAPQSSGVMLQNNKIVPWLSNVCNRQFDALGMGYLRIGLPTIQ